MASPLDSHHPSSGRGLALLLDEDPAARQVLSQVLKAEGFPVRVAGSEAELLACCETESVDIVFLAAVRAGETAVALAARTRQLTQDGFVSIILMGAPDDERVMVDCVAAGGDDFLTKPLSPSLLRARLLAAERVRDLQRAMAASGTSLTELLERDRRELLLAERIFRGAISNRNVETDQIQTYQRSATTFNGDLVLTQRLPDGGLRALVADITGHGLGATIGALPVAEAFHAMTLKGADDASVLREINRKLHGLLTSDRFMAVFMLSLTGDGRQLSWWNGGMPSGWLRGRDGLIELASHALPLGVLAELPGDDAPRLQQVEVGDAVLVLTDGLVAALDREGTAFGEDRLGRCLSAWPHGGAVLPALRDAVQRYCGERTLSDDMALLELRVVSGALAAVKPVPTSARRARRGAWSWSLELSPAQPPRAHRLGALLQPLGLLDGLEPQTALLEQIIAILSQATDAAAAERQEASLMPGAGPQASVDRYRLEIDYASLPEGGRFRVGVSAVPSAAAAPDPGMDAQARAALGAALSQLQTPGQSIDLESDGRTLRVAYRW